MSYFNAEMHEIQFRLPQTPLGELTVLPRPPAGFKGPTSKGKEGRGREEGREGKDRGGKRKT